MAEMVTTNATAAVGSAKSNMPTSQIESSSVAVKNSISETEHARAKVDQTSDLDDLTLKRLSNVKLSITIDESASLPVIKVFDSESGDEILQVPAEHSLNISRTIKAAVGAIFDKRA